MNTRAIVSIAVLLAFAAGFMSAEMLNESGSNNGLPGVNVTEITSNNTTVMVINDRDYFPVVINKINEAKKSIHVVMFEMVWSNSSTTDVAKLGSALVNASHRGVEVKIIFEDGHTHGFSFTRLPYYVEKWSSYFKSNGIQVKVDWSNQTTHDKLVIIDGTIVIVGSTNWSDSALEYNHEADALIENKDVAREYEKYFQTLWNEFH